MINRYDKCIGIRLWKTNRRFWQLWFCPAGYEIARHSHPEEDIELMYLFGQCTFYRRYPACYAQSFTPKWYNIFKRFSVSAGVEHWFTVSRWPLIFVNFSTFKPGITPKSAAIDFKVTL